MELKSIITISGRISSGKSYLAERLQAHLGIPIASFGQYLRTYCELNGIQPDRKNLQNLGEKLVGANPKKFAIDVISHFVGSADSIIVEGVRHTSIFQEVKHLCRDHTAIFVEADSHTRYQRYKNRRRRTYAAKSFDEFLILDAHPVEQQIDSLRTVSDLVLDSTIDYSKQLLDFLHVRYGPSKNS